MNESIWFIPSSLQYEYQSWISKVHLTTKILMVNLYGARSFPLIYWVVESLLVEVNCWLFDLRYQLEIGCLSPVRKLTTWIMLNQHGHQSSIEVLLLLVFREMLLSSMGKKINTIFLYRLPFNWPVYYIYLLCIDLGYEWSRNVMWCFVMKYLHYIE